jgi:superoxide dismutase
MLAPNGTSEPSGPLGEAIRRDYGSFANMVQQLSDSSLAIQGVGYILSILSNRVIFLTFDFLVWLGLVRFQQKIKQT